MTLRAGENRLPPLLLEDGMKVLLTGMSGAGKSTLLRALKTAENLTVDMDYDGWIEYDEEYGERAIDIERALKLFKENPGREILLAGTAINQGKLYPHLDAVIVLTAPLDVMRRRVLERADNPFGKHPDEWAQIVRDKQEIEPLLIRGATYVCDSSGTLEETAARVRGYMNKDR